MKWDYENHYSRRFTATDEILITRGTQGIAARNAGTGKLLWFTKIESDEGDADPLIFQQMAIVSSVKDCSVLALDLRTGKEIWRLQIPDCTYYYIFGD